MRIVTKRHGNASPVEDSRHLQRTINRLRGGALVPMGVYRFRSFEEADQWMTQKMIDTLVRRKSKTSSRSAGR